MSDLNKSSILAMVTSVTALTLAATDIYLPALIKIAEDLQTTHGAVQDTISFYFLTFAMGQLVVGPLSDRFGRRKVMLVSQTIFLLGTLAAAFSASIEMLVTTRVFQAIGACAGTVLGRAIIKETFDKSQVMKAMTLYGMVLSLAPAVAPMIGAALDTFFGWQAIFLFLAACIAAVTLTVAMYLPETHHERLEVLSFRSLQKDYRMLLNSRPYMRYVLTLALMNSGIYAIIISSAFVFMKAYDMSEATYSVTYSSHVILFIVGAALGAPVSKKIGIDRTIALGTSLAALNGIFLLSLCYQPQPSLWMLLSGTIIFSTTSGFVFPSCNISAIMVYEKIAGTASAMLSFLLYGMGAVVGLTISQIARGNSSPLPMVFAIGSVSILAWVVFWGLGKKVR